VSKNRFDRQRRPMSWKMSQTVLTGGLDERSSGLGMGAGRLIACLNFEELYGKQGYTFVKGYERYDGKAAPSDADYGVVDYDSGNTTAIVAGDTIVNAAATASGVVVYITLTAGSWAGGNAAGTIYFVAGVGTFADNNNLRVGGVQRAMANGAGRVSSESDIDREAALLAAREYYRNLIGVPIGAGPILGGCVFKGIVWCMRDVLGNASATLWKSSSTGWVSVQSGLHSGGSYKFEVANFSGATDDESMYFLNGKSRALRIKGSDLSFSKPSGVMWGSEGTSVSSHTLAFGSKAFVVAQASRDWVIGDELTAWDATTAARWVSGTVTAYNSGTNTVTIDVTDSSNGGGVGPAYTDWEIGRTDFSDKAYLLKAHKNHMFYAVPGGQLQTSDLGVARTFTSTASLFGMGQDIADIVSLKGKALGVFCESKISVLDGSSAVDWVMGTYSNGAGVIPASSQENNGNAIFLTRAGISTLQATEAFGDFENSAFSSDSDRTLARLRSDAPVVGSRMARNNYQYRLYFSDGSQLRYTMLNGSAAAPTPEDVSASYVKYSDVITCAFSGIMADGQEHMFFGSTGGFVMEEDVGTSFDGEDIQYIALLAYEHYNSPSEDKAFHKIEMEVAFVEPLTLAVRQLFDFDSGNLISADLTETLPEGQDDYTVLLQDVSRMTSQLVEIYANGIARNMALMIYAESNYVQPVTLQTFQTYYSKLGRRP
jgi:hypothetical protein